MNGINGIGIPSKIKSCGQQYVDTKTGKKYKQIDCPQGNNWIPTDIDSSNDSVGNISVERPNGDLGNNIYSEVVPVSYNDLVLIHSTPYLVLTITNTGSTPAIFSFLDVSSLSEGTIFTNSNLYCYITGGGWTKSNGGLGTFFFNSTNFQNTIPVNRQSYWYLLKSLVIFPSTSVNVYFESPSQLTGGGADSVITLFMNYTLSYF